MGNGKCKRLRLSMLLFIVAAMILFGISSSTAAAKTIKIVDAGNMKVEFQDTYTVVIKNTVNSAASAMKTAYPKVTRVIVAEGVTQLPEGLFRCFPGTETLELPSSLKSLGSDNERDASNYSAYINSNLKNLKYVTVKSSNKTYKSLDGVLYTKGGTKLLLYPSQKKSTYYKVPDSVAYFYLGNSYVKEIYLGKKTIDFHLDTPSLAGFKVSSQNKDYSASNGVLYSSDKKRLLYYPQEKKDTSFTIPNTVEMAYITSQYLKVLTLGDKISSFSTYNPLGQNQALPALSAYKVSSENSVYSVIDGVLYSKDKKFLMDYPNSKGSSYQVPEGTTKIEDRAFANKKLTSITLPQSLKVIGRNAFSGTGITAITLPANFTYFSEDAFDNTEIAAVNVDSGNQVLFSKDGVVYTKTQCQIFYWPEAKAEENLTFPDNLNLLNLSQVKHLEKAKTIVIPKALASIVNTGNNNLKKITLAEGNTSFVLNQGILYASNLTAVKLYPNDNPVTKIVLPEQVTSLDLKMFLHENTTTSITLSQNLKYFQYTDDLYNIKSSYLGFYHLKEVLIPEENPYFKSVDGILYTKDMSYLWWYPQNSPKEVYVMPGTVTGIAPMQLVNAANLTKLELPAALSVDTPVNDSPWDSVVNDKIIGTYCPKLVSIKVDEANKELKAVDGVLYNKAQWALLLYPSAKTDKTFKVPDEVQVVNNRTYNPYLEEITLSKNTYYLRGEGSDDDYAYACHDPFLYFTALKSIKVDSENKYYQSIDGVLYDKGYKALTAFPVAWSSKTLKIPTDIKYIQCKGNLEAAANLKEIQKEGNIMATSNKGISSYNINSFILPGSTKSILAGYVTKLLQLNRTLEEVSSPEGEGMNPIEAKTLVDWNLSDTYYVSKDNNKTYAGEKTVYITDETVDLKQVFAGKAEQAERVIWAEGIVKVPSDALTLFPNASQLDFPSTFYSLQDEKSEELHNVFLVARKLRDAFPRLAAVNVKAENNWFSSKEGILYNRELSELYLYPAKKEASSYVVPDTVKDISRINEINNDGSSLINQNLKEVYMGAWYMYTTYSIMKKHFVNLETVKISPYNVYFKLINGKPVTLEAYR